MLTLNWSCLKVAGITETTWQLSATWSSTRPQLIPLAPDGTRKDPSENLALSSALEMGLITAKFMGPFLCGFQMAAANRLIPSSERSSVRSLGIRTVLLASSTKEVLARVNWYDPKKKVLFLMIGPPIVAPPSFLLRMGRSRPARLKKKSLAISLSF